MPELRGKKRPTVLQSTALLLCSTSQKNRGYRGAKGEPSTVPERMTAAMNGKERGLVRERWVSGEGKEIILEEEEEERREDGWAHPPEMAHMCLLKENS